MTLCLKDSFRHGTLERTPRLLVILAIMFVIIFIYFVLMVLLFIIMFSSLFSMTLFNMSVH